MKVTLNDDLVDALEKTRRPRQTLQGAIEERLRESLEVQGAPRIVLGPTELDSLAAALGTALPLRDRASLQSAAESCGQLHLGHVRLQWTPPQLRQIQDRATKAGMSLEGFVAAVAARVLTDIFQVAPADVPIEIEQYLMAGTPEDLAALAAQQTQAPARSA